MDNIFTANDLERAQQALRNIHTILAAIDSRADRSNVFYEIGRAQGEAWLGLNHSGAMNLPSLSRALTHDPNPVETPGR